MRFKGSLNGTGDLTIGRERLKLRYQAASMHLISNLRNESPGEMLRSSLECRTMYPFSRSSVQPLSLILVTALLTYPDRASHLGRSAAQVTFFCPRQNISVCLPPTPVAQAYLAIAAQQYQI